MILRPPCGVRRVGLGDGSITRALGGGLLGRRRRAVKVTMEACPGEVGQCAPEHEVAPVEAHGRRRKGCGDGG